MMIQNVQFTGQPSRANKNAQNPFAANLSPQAQFEKRAERIQKQIQAVQENESYDEETKKSKIEELRNQMKELEAEKAAQLREAALEKQKEAQQKKAEKNSRTQTSIDGDTVELGLDTETFLNADINIRQLKSAHSQKVKSEGRAGVLKAEIETDRERGVDTSGSEKELAKVEAAAEKFAENMGEAAKSALESVEDKAKDDKLSNEEDNAENKETKREEESLGLGLTSLDSGAMSEGQKA